MRLGEMTHLDARPLACEDRGMDETCADVGGWCGCENSGEDSCSRCDASYLMTADVLRLQANAKGEVRALRPVPRDVWHSRTWLRAEFERHACVMTLFASVQERMRAWSGHVRAVVAQHVTPPPIAGELVDG